MAISDTDRGDAPPPPFVPEADHEAPAYEPDTPEPFTTHPAAPYASASTFDPPPQLDLGQEEVRLPWLEGDDEDYEEERGGLGQGALLVLLGLAAIGLIVGSVFWLTRKRDEVLVADGGVIAAPKEPYKVRPDNPGGEVVAGTGDTSFAVAEGESRSPRIGGVEAPAPGFDSLGGKNDPKPAPSSSAKAAAPAAGDAPAGGIGVQVGAYASRDQAEAGWATLKAQYSELGAVRHRIVQGQADIGTVYRLQAVPGDLNAARTLCSGMKAAGLSCQVKN